jgi:four helix bundle protein
MTAKELKIRTKKFAIDVLRFLEKIPDKNPYRAINNQLCRAAMSVGANYRAAVRAKSTADFINKLKIVEEECDECMYFLEILEELSLNNKDNIKLLHNEANELLSIFVASIKTSRNKLNRKS